MGDSVIVAVIMIGMIVAGSLGVFIATKNGNSGFISAVKYKENTKDKETKKTKEDKEDKKDTE